MRCLFPWIHRWRYVSRREFGLSYSAWVATAGLPDEWTYKLCVRCGDGRMRR